ncbi:dephospho-CoA kinase [Synechocystis sp. PCC 7509]|uniref:dephospho-CoA kinase n=1 Tax=Synechocystis sp. PCC 7509 TaxID=927677 RepID=UPI0002AD11AB|nr:dephospho-CoA kinase [Synechocystis sp. PCC 7509]
MNSKNNRRLIGLTGGISTGKSTVSKYLETKYKLQILDADIYARDAVKIGSPAIKAIASRYGESILLADGSLNRQQLGSILFKDASERQWLEKQIHPYVRNAFEKEIDNSNPDIVIVVPLLFEAGMTDLVTEIWVVYCNPHQQLARLMERESLTPEAAQSRINSQMPLKEKCDRADLILDNSSSLESLFKQVDIAMLNPPPLPRQ